MPLTQQIIEEIAIDVWQTMLGMELTPVDCRFHHPDRLAATVEIRGSRLWIVDVFADEPLRALIAEAMFSTDRDMLSDEEICDAFGEIANMIGGNFKGQFDEDSQLSTPVVRQLGETFFCHVPGRVRSTFECDGYQLSVVVTEFEVCHQTLEAVSAI